MLSLEKKSGVCKYGDKCKFSHAPEERGIHAQSGGGKGKGCFKCGGDHLAKDCPNKGKGQDQPSPKKKGLCFAWRDHGECKNMKDCRFDHPPDKRGIGKPGEGKVQPGGGQAGGIASRQGGQHYGIWEDGVLGVHNVHSGKHSQDKSNIGQVEVEMSALTFVENLGPHAVKTLNALDQSNFVRRSRARPAGFVALCKGYTGRRPLILMCDSGASCCAIPEEVAVPIIVACLEDVKAGRYKTDDEVYPISGLEVYDEEEEISGVSSEHTMRIKYGIVLRLQWVPLGGTPKEAKPVYTDVLFKVFPRGYCRFKGAFLGQPVLEPAPMGFGFQTGLHSHTFRALGINVERIELTQRDRYLSEKSTYNSIHSLGQLEEFFLGSAVPRAIYDGDELVLEPGEGAAIKVQWTRPVSEGVGVVPSAEAFAGEDASLDLLEGIWGDSRDGVVFIGNDSVLDIILEPGKEVAIASGACVETGCV